jgi:glycosyltransferase involved in cell wall biosynthesis
VFSDSVPEYTAGRSRLRRWAAESYKRWYLQGFDAAVVSGEQARAYLVGLGVPRDRVFLGLDVVDNDMIGRAADEARCAGDETSGSMHRRFVVPARMIPRKNHLRLIDAYARYRRGCEGEPWDMLLIGGGPTETIIDERIASCGVPGLRHIPFISDPRVLGHHYGSASAMVLPSWLETWGLVLNEGAAAGLPLLASRQIPATQHLIREGENGWTFDALDVGDIADALAKVASQPRATLERMGRISREMVSDWGLDRHVREIASALRMSLVHPRHSVTRRGTTARLSGPSRRARSRPRPPRVIAKGWR